MAGIWVDGHEVSIVFPLEEQGCAIVSTHLLHVCFKFVELSIYVKEEKHSQSGEIQQSIPIARSTSSDGCCWYLRSGNYRAYGLPLHMPPLSAEIGSRQSAGSTVNRPFIPDTGMTSPLPECLARFPSNRTPTIVKVEKLDTIIELSSESKGESPTLIPTLKLGPLQRGSEENNPGPSAWTTPYSTRLQPSISYSQLHRIPINHRSIMECLKGLSNLHHSRNELSTMDLGTLTHQQMEFLPPAYDGDAIFELPLCRPSSSSLAAKNLEGMDKHSDGHPWCKLVTTNIHNSDNLKFHKFFCL